MFTGNDGAKKLKYAIERLTKRVLKLEKDSHPCKELHEFDAYPALIERIEKLEKLLK
mgnify:CR=1 FL=1